MLLDSTIHSSFTGKDDSQNYSNEHVVHATSAMMLSCGYVALGMYAIPCAETSTISCAVYPDGKPHVVYRQGKRQTRDGEDSTPRRSGKGKYSK